VPGCAPLIRVRSRAIPRSAQLYTGEAGVLWRHEALRDLEWKAKCLRLEENEEAQSLLAKIAEHTAYLTALWEQQQSSDAQVPWWADGEYSDTGADR